MQVAKDGTLLVDERITYAFSGPFSGGYRDIPVRKGESVARRAGARGRAPRTGRAAASSSAAPTPAGHVRRRRASAAATRVVWHYAANNEARTFEIRYALRGVAVAYDDVVDVNLQVWGDEWDVSLGRLTATLDGARARSCARGAIPSRCAATCSSPATARCCARSTCRRTSSSSCAR